MSERALQVTEKCEAFTKSLRAMFDAALPCPSPPSFNHDCICCFAFTCICMTLLAYACRCHRVVIVCRYMLLYQFENLQYIEHKQEIEVQRGRSAAADASQRLRELMVSAGAGNHLSAVRFLWR